MRRLWNNSCCCCYKKVKKRRSSQQSCRRYWQHKCSFGRTDQRPKDWKSKQCALWNSDCSQQHSQSQNWHNMITIAHLGWGSLHWSKNRCSTYCHRYCSQSAPNAMLGLKPAAWNSTQRMYNQLYSPTSECHAFHLMKTDWQNCSIASIYRMMMSGTRYSVRIKASATHFLDSCCYC